MMSNGFIVYCTDFEGFGKPLFNNPLVNAQNHKRFLIVNCAAISQNLTEKFYRITKTFNVTNSSEVNYTFPSIRLLLVGKKITSYIRMWYRV